VPEPKLGSDRNKAGMKYGVIYAYWAIMMVGQGKK